MTDRSGLTFDRSETCLLLFSFSFSCSSFSSSFLLPNSSFLLPNSSFLLPSSFFLLPPSSFLLPPPSSCVSFSFLLPPSSYFSVSFSFSFSFSFSSFSSSPSLKRWVGFLTSMDHAAPAVTAVHIKAENIFCRTGPLFRCVSH